jgi:Biotin-requiring enzyme
MMRWFGKMIRINLPDLGEGTKEATIKEWFVKEGQKIKEVGILMVHHNNMKYSMTTYAKCSLTNWLPRFHPLTTV